MKLTFKGTTNDSDVWVNDISFQLASGEVIAINRTITKYVIENGCLSMIWYGCHIRKPGKKSDYTIKAKDLNGAELIEINSRDDAPDRYFIKITEWKAEDS